MVLFIKDPSPGTTTDGTIIRTDQHNKMVDFFQDTTDSTKTISSDTSGATTGKNCVLKFIHTLARTITFPDATTTLAALNVAATWLQKQIFTACLLQARDILDSAGLKIIDLITTASAVNFFELTNSATGGLLKLFAKGTDTDISLQLSPKGAGTVFGNRETSSYPISDESTVFTTGVKFVTEAWPYDFAIERIDVTVTVAGTGATLVKFDVLKENSINANAFTTIFTTKPTIDASEFTTQTAATPSVLSVTTIEKGKRLQLKVDTLDSNNLAAGGKITIIGHATAV